LQESVVFENFLRLRDVDDDGHRVLFHGNDFEYDTASAFEGMLPNRNNPHLFSILEAHGYRSNLICLNGYQHKRPIELGPWNDELPPAWGTHDFPTLFAKFDELTAPNRSRSMSGISSRTSSTALHCRRARPGLPTSSAGPGRLPTMR
jgi:hypothetical protein